MRVKVSAEVPVERHEVRRIGRLLGRSMRRIGLGSGLELSVILVGEERIRELNRAYLGSDEATDVLAFPQLSEDELDEAGRSKSFHPEPLGDIAICLPVARRQAEEMGIPEEDELDLLAVHGLLHLAGFDDETALGAERMRAMETALLGRSIYCKSDKE
jgi:probable rRNA maturation factor